MIMLTNKLISRLICTVALIVLAGGAAAQLPDGPGRKPTPGELALLPEFCQDVQTINGWEQHVRESPRSPMWISKMGKAFWAMHHYCWARNAIYRSQAPGTPKHHRDFLIQAAINDMKYVVENSDSTNAILPEIYYLMGDYSRMLEKYADAIAMFQKSREIKPDYWPAYAGEADLLMLGKQNQKARAVLQRGLSEVPTAVALKSRLKRLGNVAEAVDAADGGETESAIGKR